MFVLKSLYAVHSMQLLCKSFRLSTVLHVFQHIFPSSSSSSIVEFVVSSLVRINGRKIVARVREFVGFKRIPLMPPVTVYETLFTTSSNMDAVWLWLHRISLWRRLVKEFHARLPIFNNYIVYYAVMHNAYA